MSRTVPTGDDPTLGVESWLSLTTISEDGPLAVARRERERCAAVADERVMMWQAGVSRMGTGTWSAAAVAEARARLNEARALADALRVSLSSPPGT